MQDLRGQHVVVTGATGPLGRAVCAAALACGASVTAASLHRTELDDVRAELRQHDRLHIAEADLTDGPAVERLFDALERGTGPVSAVVHCVGGYSYGALVDTTDATIDALDRALLRTPTLVLRAAVRRMLPRRSGRVVLVGSMASTRPAPNSAVYGALKAAVAHLAQSVAAEVRASGVTVNAVLPGVLDTPANRRDMPSADVARWVAPATVAESVLALLGAEARGVTGALVTLPDGVS